VRYAKVGNRVNLAVGVVACRSRACLFAATRYQLPAKLLHHACARCYRTWRRLEKSSFPPAEAPRLEGNKFEKAEGTRNKKPPTQRYSLVLGEYHNNNLWVSVERVSQQNRFVFFLSGEEALDGKMACDTVDVFQEDGRGTPFSQGLNRPGQLRRSLVNHVHSQLV